jgi:hypothetical protein
MSGFDETILQFFQFAVVFQSVFGLLASFLFLGLTAMHTFA